jgi:hypothetical protein
VALTILSMMLGAIGGAPVAAAMGVFTLLALVVLWLIGIGMTLTGMSELAWVVERKRDAREDVISEN